MYFDEIEFYVKRIQKEKASERLTDLAIAHNPNSKDPNKLVASFKKQLQQYEEKSFMTKERMTKEDERKLRELARTMKRNAEARRKG